MSSLEILLVLPTSAPTPIFYFFFSPPPFRSFTILNPTSNAYSFFWVPEETESLQNPPAFTCLTEKGNIYPDKRAEVCGGRVRCLLGWETLSNQCS